MRYHYVITLQATDRGKATFVGQAGTVTGSKASEIFEDTFKSCCEMHGLNPANTIALFWSLMKDDLD